MYYLYYVSFSLFFFDLLKMKLRVGYEFFHNMQNYVHYPIHFVIMLIFFFHLLLFTIYYFHYMYYCLIVYMLIFFAKSQKNYSFHCIYVYVYCNYFLSMFIYFVVCQLYYMSYWLSAKNSTISSIVFRQCSSCFIDFSIMLEMVLTQPYFND